MNTAQCDVSVMMIVQCHVTFVETLPVSFCHDTLTVLFHFIFLMHSFFYLYSFKLYMIVLLMN